MSGDLRLGSAAEAGLDAERLAVAEHLLQGWVDDGTVSGAALALARGGVQVPTRAFGVRRRLGHEAPMAPDSVFLVASVTKPVTATALVQRIERGAVSLSDPVARHIPELVGPGKQDIRIEHLLTHTSGLPDMLPENEALRVRHAPLTEFVAGTCRCQLLFAPGTRVSYQSMGTLLAAQVVERLDGRPLPQTMAEDIFTPLGMAATHLGSRQDLEARSAEVELPVEQQGTDWHWNTEYWRGLGAPWGGMFATVDDLLRFLSAFLGGGALGSARILGTATAQAMIADRTAHMAGLPAADRLQQRWGLGWRLGAWGELASPRAFSHGGATGTLVGADPDSGLAVAVFTTRPGAPLQRVVTAVQAAVLD